MAGALSTLASMLVGHSLPISKLGPQHYEQLQKLLLPDETLLVHGSSDPIYQLYNTAAAHNARPGVSVNGQRILEMYLADHPLASYNYAGFGGGYLTPFAVPKQHIGTGPDRWGGLSYDYPENPDRLVDYTPEAVSVDEPGAIPKKLLKYWGVDANDLYNADFPEYTTRFQGVLNPLSRRITGEHARGGLI